MLFVVLSYDNVATGRDVRARTRAAHLEYVFRNKDAMRYGGALLAENGDMIGTLAIVELPDRPSLDSFLSGDPYNQAALFDRVVIHETKQMLPEPAAGSFASELARAQGGRIPAGSAGGLRTT